LDARIDINALGGVPGPVTGGVTAITPFEALVPA